MVCSQCSDALQLSPGGYACSPMDSTQPAWLIPVVVVAVVVPVAVVVAAVAFVVRRRRRASLPPRPPLPRPDELDDLPAAETSKKRPSVMNRLRYTRSPKRSQHLTLQVIKSNHLNTGSNSL